MSKQAKPDRRLRADRLGFRVDSQTRAMIERAAKLERRKLTDFCMTALTDAARRTIESHQNLMLSERDRSAFFAVLAAPPPVNARLKRASAARKRRVLS